MDFYRNIDSETVSILNQYFDIVFCACLEEPLKTMIYKFRGTVVLRAFGLVEKKTYAGLIQYLFGHQALGQIKKMGKRF